MNELAKNEPSSKLVRVRNLERFRAVQWAGLLDTLLVERREPKLVFSKDGLFFFVAHFDPALASPKLWVIADPTAERPEGTPKDDDLHFMEWHLPKGEAKSIETDSDKLLVARYAQKMGWDHSPRTCGYCQSAGLPVEPNDWLVMDEKNTMVVGAAEFDKIFEEITEHVTDPDPEAAPAAVIEGAA